MAYVKQTWTDRVVEFARRFTYTQDGTHITLTPEPGTVTEVGTPVDASRLNHIEDGIKAIDTNLNLVDTTVASHLADYVTHEEEHFTDAHTAKYYAGIDGGTHSIADSTFTALAFNNVTYDSTGDMAPGARLACRKTGLYLIVGRVFYETNGDGARYARLQKNDSDALATVRHGNAGTTPTEIIVTSLVLLNNGDYVKLQAFQNSGGSLNVNGNLTMTKVG